MKVLLDMNLSPAWAEVLARAGHDAVHWSAIGDPRASDAELLAWARENRRVVMTLDLDFSIILALSRSAGPSVVQLRAPDATPAALGATLCATLAEHAASLDQGAILTLDEARSRVRILPLL